MEEDKGKKPIKKTNNSLGPYHFYFIHFRVLPVRIWFSGRKTSVESPDGLATMRQRSISTVLLPVSNDLMLLDTTS